MWAWIVVVARFVQYGGAAVLFGAPLFFLCGLPHEGDGSGARLGWPRSVFRGVAGLLLVAAYVSLAAETVSMTENPADAYSPDALWSVLTGTHFGLGMGVRLGAAIALLGLTIFVRPSVALWSGLAGAGAIALASFAWTGHAAAESGWAGLIHAGADVAHLLAAGVWLGALTALTGLAFDRGIQIEARSLAAFHDGLAGFSGIGRAVVAVLVVTGAINGFYLVGLKAWSKLFTSAYGLLLMAKLGLFAVMLGLAAINRFVHTPRLQTAAGISPSPSSPSWPGRCATGPASPLASRSVEGDLRMD